MKLIQIIKSNKYLIYTLVKRDFQTAFRQTVLGVLWFFLVPLITTIVFTFVFGRFSNISTNNIPPVLFYMSGVVLWNLFSGTFIGVSNSFSSYQSILSKVYFSRIIVPISVVVSNLIKFGIQFILFIFFWLYFLIKGDVTLHWTLVLVPVIILLVSALAFSMGLVCCSLSYKYKDLQPIIGIFVMLLMYVTPVIYPVSFLPKGFQPYAYLNPLSGPFEILRHCIFGGKTLDIFAALLFFPVLITLYYVGVSMFNKAERTFVDTI